MTTGHKNSSPDTESTPANLAEHLADQGRQAVKAAGRLAEDATTAAKRKIEDAGDKMRDTFEEVKSTAEDGLTEGRSQVTQAVRKAQDVAGDAKDALVAGAGSTLAITDCP